MRTTETPVTRPRVEGEREAEIYAAVVQLLMESGYDKLTFDAVASRVRVSKATLYRKWASKASLVVDAVVSEICPTQLAVPDTGTLRGDLVAGACEERGLTSDLPTLIGAIIPAMHRDADLYEAVRTQFLDPNVERGLAIFRRAQQRGEIGRDADLHQLSTILPAMCIHENLVFRREVGRSSVVKIIDDVVLPACRATVVD